MSNNISILEELKSQEEELQDKITIYKRLSNENLKINKKIFEEDKIDDNIEELANCKEVLDEIISIENSAN